MGSFVPLVMSTQPSPASKPSKPLRRRSTLSGTIRKSEDAGLDSELLSTPSSPNKRVKVTFSPTIEEKAMAEFNVRGRSLESVRAEVKRSLEGHARGSSEGYDSIKEVFALKTEDMEEKKEANEEMRTYLLALTSHASLLNGGCNGLIQSILACEWMGRDERFVRAYVHFLGSLASAHGAYVGMVMVMLVGHFYGVRPSIGRLSGYPDVSRDQLSLRVHVALKYLLRLVPSASSTLSPILSNKFPFADDSKRVHITYINNLISLLEYAPELKSEIFALITDRLVKIDVQMQVDLDDLDDEVAAAIVEAISLNPSNLANENREDSDESDVESVGSDESLQEDTKRIKEVQSNVEKMDAILDLLFTIYDPYFSDPNSVEATDMFETLLSHFSSIILPTYRSRHTQFLLFHFAQLTETLVDRFAGTCVQLAFQSNRPAVLRQSAAAYLASFVARGAHVKPYVVRTVFEVIGDNLENFRLENELNCRGPDLQRYTTFYAMTQALLYIFCFRWRDLLRTPDDFDEKDPTEFLRQDLEWVPGVKETLISALYSEFNPLKICSPPIVSEFAKIARHLKFMYVYGLLETNKRIRLSQYASSQADGAQRGSEGHSESWHQLDTYFPFDPYQLPLSKGWIENDYVQWKVIPGISQDEEEEDESDDDETRDLDTEDPDTATDEDDDE